MNSNESQSNILLPFSGANQLPVADQIRNPIRVPTTVYIRFIVDPRPCKPTYVKVESRLPHDEDGDFLSNSRTIIGQRSMVGRTIDFVEPTRRRSQSKLRENFANA